MASRKPRRLGVTLALLVTIALALATGLLLVLANDHQVNALTLDPVYTPAPPRPLFPTPLGGPTETPVVALANLVEAASVPGQPTEAAALKIPPPAPAAELERPAAAPVIRLFLPMALRDYTPPPRQPEAFFVLANLPADQWPAEAAGLTQSKIGLHALSTGDPYTMEFVRRTKPRVVKAVGDFGWLAEVKQVSPETVTLARIYGQDESWVNTLDPAVAAAAYIQERLEHYQLNPFVDYWEGWNEFIFGSPEQLRWYAQFEAERACQMQALGFRAAVGGFAVGWPNTYADMEVFLPALEAAHRCGGLFHLHEYNKPLLQCGVRSGEAEIIPGAPAVRVPAGPLTFRYRFWYEGYLKPRGLGELPLVISEFGIDGVRAILCEDPNPWSGTTWKDYADWWQQGLGVDGAQAYVSQFAWADREMRQDDYVIGATIFTVGATDSGNHWNRWDVHDVLIPLAHYLVSQH